jgi:hypothetical protein
VYAIYAGQGSAMLRDQSVTPSLRAIFIVNRRPRLVVRQQKRRRSRANAAAQCPRG